MKDIKKAEEELLIKYTRALELIAQLQHSVSDFKLAEGIAKQKEDRFHALVNASSDVIYHMNPDWSDMYQLQSNGFLRNTSGQTSDWLHGYIPPDDHPSVLAAINKAILTKSVFDLEHRVYKTDGSIGWAHSRAVPVFDKDDEVIEWLGIARDITERKEAERFRDGLDEINTLVHSILSFDEIMNKIIVEASKILGVESAGISLRRGDRWLVSYIFNLPREILGMQMNDRQEPHALLAIKTKKPVVITDAFYDERVNRKHMKKWCIKSVMVVPLLTQEEVIGVIFFNYHSRRFTFTENHIEFGTKLASTVSFGVRNALLFEEVQKELSERKQAQEELRDKEAQLQLIADATPVLLTRISRDLRYLFVNHAFAEMLGHNPEEIVGKPVVEVIGKQAFETIRPYVERVLQGERVEYEREIDYQNSGPRFMHVTYIPERNGQGEVVGWLASILNITERKQAQEKLRESEERYREIVETANEGIATHEPDGTIIYVNQRMAEILGYSPDEIIGTLSLDFVDDEEREKVIKAQESIKQQGSFNIERRLHRKDGSIVWTSANISSRRDRNSNFLGYLAIHTDITERKKAEEELRTYREGLEELVHERTLELEEKNRMLSEEIAERKRAEEEKHKLEAQLIQAQKLEALGSLAGGIAHDMNNILYPIVINTETLLDEASPGTQAHEMLSQTLESAYRQRDLVKQILAFSKRSMQMFNPISIVPLLEHTLKFIRSTTPSSIEIKHSFNAPIDTIMGDPTQIQQVIMNLCKNAADAIDTQKGIIEISISNVHLEENPAMPEMKSGKYLELIVQDTGQGIPPDMIDQVFDPYFTTKSVGKGSGLGLSVVYGIVQKHGGAITVTSTVGEGSRFTVHLPLIDQGARAHAQAVAGQDTSRKKILFIDDENTVVSTITRALERAGYDVVGLTDAQEALGLFLEDPSAFDLVITDMTMPVMTGIELGRKIKEASPEIPIILCTGFSDIISTQEAKDKCFTGLLTKPAGIRELKEAIRQALED